MRKSYFIGIGGIGMSALAQLFKERGEEVSGSDREESPVREMLKAKGIQVLIGQGARNVPEDAAVAIYSDAVPENNPERARARELGIPELSYFQMLGEVAAGFPKSIAVSGTHGKTTTTGMLAKILRDGGANPTAIVGSIVRDFGSNYLPGSKDLFVVEACEYRDHLLELTPDILVLNNLEWDHTDFFPSLAALQETFRKALSKVPLGGAIVTDPAQPNIAPLLEEITAPVVDYTKEPAYTLSLPGEFNQMNARAAASAARLILPQLTTGAIAASLASFHGTWRRFEYKGKTKDGAEVYDDYAHHPTAVKETLRALRALRDSGTSQSLSTSGQNKVYVAFHPHLYSRTRDLLEGFARAFADADEVLIAPIYAARELDDGSVSSELLASKIRAAGAPPRGTIRALPLEEIERVLAEEPRAGDLIMTMGAGDIYKIADRLVEK